MPAASSRIDFRSIGLEVTNCPIRPWLISDGECAPVDRSQILIDSYNPKTKKSNIFETDFTKACPKDYYKGGLTIQKGRTYHFYRQDKNSRYSHKQGTLKVENVDASGNPIYAPHLADKNYNKSKSKNGIAYDEWCGYYCIPRNYKAKTQISTSNSI